MNRNASQKLSIFDFQSNAKTIMEGVDTTQYEMIGKKYSNKIDTTNWVNRAHIIVPPMRSLQGETEVVDRL
jgi:hypothetical protein